MSDSLKQLILEKLNESGDAVKPEALLKFLGEGVDLPETENCLRLLEREGKVVRTKKGRVMSAAAAGLVTAQVVSLCKGFAFARPEGASEDVFIHRRDLQNAMPRDRVLLSVNSDGPKGPSGKVVNVVDSKPLDITGEISGRPGRLEFVPDSLFRFSIPVDKKDLRGAGFGDKVLARVTCNRLGEISARVVKMYGNADSAKICADSIIDANGIPAEFPSEVPEQARELQRQGITASDLKGRVDLRAKIVFTIDGADAKDLDDAVSIERTGEGYLLGVHICDVSHFIKAGTPLDECAFERGTSVYFADRVIPMFPTEISNDLCSLNSGEDKLCFSAFIEFDSRGKMRGYEFKKSVINSCVRGVYSEVNKILAGEADSGILKKYERVLDSLAIMNELAVKLKANSLSRGALDIVTTESAFTLDEKGAPVDVRARQTGPAQELIEEFMISANVAAALYAKSAGVPFVYRVHESPTAEKIRALAETAKLLGFDVRRIKEGLRSSDLAVLLEASKETKYSLLISHNLLRSMAKAKYSAEPIGHFGLSLADYCHFTSPIRRYPDISIHRILSDLVYGVGVEKINRRYGDFVKRSAKTSTDCEIRAMNAERACEDCYKAEFMLQHIGKTFSGVISSVASHGVYVLLENTVEGLVRIEDFPPGNFVYDGNFAFVDRASGRQLAIGESMEVVVTGANVSLGQVDMCAAEGTPFQANE